MGEAGSLLVAFVAGFLSVASPCVLPLLPSYLTFITGLSFSTLTEEASSREVRRLTLSHSLAFVLGFSVVFVLLGASATYLGQFLAEHQAHLRRVGGVIVVLLGLHMCGVFKAEFLSHEKRLHLRSKPFGYLGSFLVGVAFAAGWSPCIGPILASILVYAGTMETMGRGMALLVAYSLGFAIPFMVVSLALNSFLALYLRFRGLMRLGMIVTGMFLITIGILIFTDRFQGLLTYL